MHLFSGGVKVDASLTLKLTVISLERAEEFAQIAASASTVPVTQDESPTTITTEPLVDHSAVVAIVKQGEAWEVLLARLDLLMKLGEKLAEVS